MQVRARRASRRAAKSYDVSRVYPLVGSDIHSREVSVKCLKPVSMPDNHKVAVSFGLHCAPYLAVKRCLYGSPRRVRQVNSLVSAAVPVAEFGKNLALVWTYPMAYRVFDHYRVAQRQLRDGHIIRIDLFIVPFGRKHVIFFQNRKIAYVVPGVANDHLDASVSNVQSVDCGSLALGKVYCSALFFDCGARSIL